jgi:predicted ester cyclase
MSTESHKAIVRRYFDEALDKRKLDILDEIVLSDCLIHRPEAPEPIRGLAAFKQALERILQVYSEFTTTIHDLIAEEDRVACRVSHRGRSSRRMDESSRTPCSRRESSQLASHRHFSLS